MRAQTKIDNLFRQYPSGLTIPAVKELVKQVNPRQRIGQGVTIVITSFYCLVQRAGASLAAPSSKCEGPTRSTQLL